MSIRNKRLQSPVKKFIEYRASSSKNGDGGTFYYYDKQTKENIEVPLPITFVDVETFGTIIGYSKNKEANIYSNERRSGDIPFTVKYHKKGTMCTGLYKDIKEMIKANGGVYATAIYGIMDKEVVKITLKGSAMSAWLERPQGDLVTITGIKEESNGATTYQVPVFEGADLTQEQVDKISVDYADLYEYLDKRSELATDDGGPTEMDEAVQDEPIYESQLSAFEEITDADLEMKVAEFKKKREEETEQYDIDSIPF